MNAVVKQKQVKLLENEIAKFEAVKASLAEGEELSDAELEYRTSLDECLAAWQAVPESSKLAAGSPDGEEWRELAGGLELRNYVNAALMGRQLEGKEAEFNAEMKLSGDQAPLALFVPSIRAADGGQLEMRADATTALTDGDYDSNTGDYVLPMFKRADIAAIGGDIQAVPTGSHKIPVIAGTGGAAEKAKGGSTDAADAAVSGIELNPRRHTIRVLTAIENFYQYADLDAALRAYIAGRLTEIVDHQVINRASTGLVNELTAPTDGTEVVAFGDLSGAIAGLIDGLAASSEADVRVLLGAKTYQVIAALFHANGGQKELQTIRNDATLVRASAHIAAPSTDNQIAILLGANAAQNLKVRIWDSITLAAEKDQNGQRVLNGHVFFAEKLCVEDGWKLESFHLA